MNRSNIYHINSVKQDAKVGKFTIKGLSLTNLIHNLIREYGEYRDGSYSVDVDTFSISDKRLLISHFESAEWYEYSCESVTKTEAMFSEYSKHIQSLIDDEVDEVYRDDMEEMRAFR